MKQFKTILGIILILFGTITIIQMASEERGAGLFGAFTGYIIILGISIWLLYSANKKDNENKIKIRTTFFVQNKKTVEDNTKQLSIEEQKQSILILKDKGLLSESEFQEKISIVNEKIILEELYQSSEYLNLKKLYESEILSENEFKQKIQTIKDKIKADKKTIELNDEDDAIYDSVGIEPIYVTQKDNDGIGWWFLLYGLLPGIGLIMTIVYFVQGKNKKGKQALISAVVGWITIYSITSLIQYTIYG